MGTHLSARPRPGSAEASAGLASALTADSVGTRSRAESSGRAGVFPGFPGGSLLGRITNRVCFLASGDRPAAAQLTELLSGEKACVRFKAKREYHMAQDFVQNKLQAEILGFDKNKKSQEEKCIQLDIMPSS